MSQAGQAACAAERERLLSHAVGLYRGDLLPGYYTDGVLAERERLSSAYLTALLSLARAQAEQGRLSEALQSAARAVGLDPLHEEAHLELMRLYTASGQASLALRQHQTLERVLKEELDVPPPEEARELARLLRERGASAAPGGSAMGTAPPAHPLPAADPAEREQASALNGSASNGTGKGQGESNTPGSSATEVPRTPTRSGRRPRRRPRRAGAWALVGAAALCAVLAVYLSRRPQDQPEPRPKPIALGMGLWEAVYAHIEPGNIGSDPTAIVLGKGESLYIAGFIQTAHNDVDFLVLRYDRNGKKVWEWLYNGPGNDVDRARSLAVDEEGCVYVTGDSFGTTGRGDAHLRELDWATVKISPDGKRNLWESRYNGEAEGLDWPVKLALDGRGGVFVTGYSWRGLGQLHDIAVVRYDARSGKELWSRRHDRPGHDCRAYDLAVAPDGSVYVAGSEKDPATGRGRAVLLRYSAAGRVLWKIHPPRSAAAHCRVAVAPRGGAYLLCEGRWRPPSRGDS